MRQKKASPLPIQKKQQIGKYKEKFPTASYHEIADNFNITYNQARSACVDYRAGKLHRTKPRPKPKAIDEITDTFSADELLERQYHKAVAALESEKNLTVDERIKLLESLFQMRKILQNLRLESFIKRADAGVIKVIIKRFLPDATDDDVIKIYLEAVERWKIESK